MDTWWHICCLLHADQVDVNSGAVTWFPAHPPHPLSWPHLRTLTCLLSTNVGNFSSVTFILAAFNFGYFPFCRCCWFHLHCLCFIIGWFTWDPLLLVGRCGPALLGAWSCLQSSCLWPVNGFWSIKGQRSKAYGQWPCHDPHLQSPHSFLWPGLHSHRPHLLVNISFGKSQYQIDLLVNISFSQYQTDDLSLAVGEGRTALVARVLPIKGSIVRLVSVQGVTLVAVPQIPELMLNLDNT